jgi:hypothetical protein
MSPVTFSTPEVPAAYEEGDFITVTELGNYLGRDLSSDPAAALVVNAATDYCRTIAEQTFTAVSNDTVYLDGTGTDSLLLPQLPVSKVRSVKDEADLVTDWTLNDNGVLFRKTAEGNASTWGLGRQRWVVAYDHGYDEVPGDVKAVALSIASRLIIQGVAAFEVVGQNQIRYDVPSTDLTAGAKMILRKYKQSR